MRTLFLLTSIVALAAAQNIQRTVHLNNATTAQAAQEVMTILRTVADLKDVSNDPAAQTLTFGGTTSQILMSEWVVRLLDQSADPDAGQIQIRNTALWQYTTPGRADDVVRVVYLKSISNPQGVQELLTNLRSVADVMKVFSYTPLKAIVLRGPAAQMALSAWIVEQLDKPGQPVDNPAAFSYTSPQHKEESVRVFYLPRIHQSRQLQDVLTAVRTQVKVQKAFCFSQPTALVLRGTREQMEASEKLIGQSDLALR